MIWPAQDLKIRNLQAQTKPYGLAGKATIASVHASAQGDAWGTAVLTPKWSNSPGGPWFTFASGELSNATIGTGDGSIAWINVQGKGYLTIEVTTAEGAVEEYVTVYVCDDSDA